MNKELKWTILNSTDDKKFVYCRCACGKEQRVRLRDIKNLTSTQCKSCAIRNRPLKIPDITGKKIGYLTPRDFVFIEKHHKKCTRRTRYWNCDCDCGKSALVREFDLILNKRKSCGCLHEFRSKGHLKFGGYGDINGTVWHNIRRSALRRDIEFKISIEYAWNLFEFQERKCALSGMELSFMERKDCRDNTASLDRIDSSKGYIEGNLQWIHKDINRMKNKYSNDYFVKICDMISKNLERQRDKEVQRTL